jgi:hypothetical protein
MIPAISFCITCMNRREQLQQTLLHNISVLASFGNSVELCLVNFIKDVEGEVIEDWVRNLGAPEQFTYFNSRELRHWHASVAKNTAHMSSRGAFLVNLDVDNFLHVDEVSRLLDFKGGDLSEAIYWGFNGTITKKIAWWRLGAYSRVEYRARLFSGARQDGSYGRIGIPRKDFIALGGYDESLPPAGGEDANLLKRVVAARSNYDLIHIPALIPPLKNTKEEGLINSLQPEANWDELNALSREITRRNIKSRQIVANNGLNLGVVAHAL